jgi:hypothetical protein
MDHGTLIVIYEYLLYDAKDIPVLECPKRLLTTSYLA